MPKMVFASPKLVVLLQQQRTYLNTLKYRLYTNILTLDAAILASMFVEPDDSGYGSVLPAGGTSPVFGVAQADGARAKIVAPTITWVFTYNGGVPFTVYGYWVSDPLDDEVVLAQEGLTTVTITGSGQTYSVTPKITDDTEV